MPTVQTTSGRSSLWTSIEAPSPRPPLRGAATADVAVIGGGIAGITAALAIQRSGASVVVLEAARIATGVTGNTSAKVSALQATTLSQIAGAHGAETARVYAAASAAAVEDVAALAGEEEIDCDLERRPAVTFAADRGELEAVRGEFGAAATAGLAVQWRDEDGGLPFPVAGAVWLDDQLGIQPVRYVRGLAGALERAGGTIHENSRVLSVKDDSPCEVHTAEGVVHAGQVVVASHFPILDRGGFFARMDAQRSYCIAARVRDAPPRAMAISAGDRSRSIQYTGDTVIIGGEGHAAGASGIGFERFAPLETYARSHWDVDRIDHRWSAQDPVPYDHLPMVGPLVPRSGRLWVATGWAKWGLTGGTFAARILAAAVAGERHEWAGTFTPSRLLLRQTPEIGRLGTRFSALMVRDRITPAEAGSADEVPLGEARVLRSGLGKVGAYRDIGGALHGVSLRCTHLGCLLRFNAAETSWDCPCHGSRFGVDGDVLEGPAVSPLDRRDVG